MCQPILFPSFAAATLYMGEDDNTENLRPLSHILRPIRYKFKELFVLFPPICFNYSNYDYHRTQSIIAADLDQMGVEMLESVFRYVRRPRVMRFKRNNPWYATDEEVDRLRYEYLTEKYK